MTECYIYISSVFELNAKCSEFHEIRQISCMKSGGFHGIWWISWMKSGGFNEIWWISWLILKNANLNM